MHFPYKKTNFPLPIVSFLTPPRICFLFLHISPALEVGGVSDKWEEEEASEKNIRVSGRSLVGWALPTLLPPFPLFMPPLSLHPR